MKINVQASYDNKFSIDVEMVDETPILKEKISALIPDCHPSELKLIYSGRILKDSDSIESIKIKENNTLHVVRSATKKVVTPSAPVSSLEASAVTTNTPVTVTSPQPPFRTLQETMPNLAGLQGMFGSSSENLFDPSQIVSQMNPDQMRPLMDMMMANPELLKASMAMNPEFMKYPPHVQEMLSKPEFIKVLMELQMAQMGAGTSPSSSDMFNAAAMMGGSGSGQNTDYMSTLASMMGSQSPTTQQTSTPAVPLVAPEIRFAAQLEQLQEMGFYDPDANIRALLACGGNVNLAVERLFQQQ